MKALLIQSPSVDFAKFLNACDKLLPHRPAAKSDADPRRLSETERWLAVLAGFRCEEQVEWDINRHASFSFLVWAPLDDLKEFVELCGMPYITTRTVNFAFTAAIVTGPLSQWRALNIDRPHLQPMIDAIQQEFKNAGMTL